MSTETLIAADGFSFPAYVARPVGTPKAGLVVLQEIFGVNSHIRSVADGFAADGYLVIAPHTFHRVQANVELGYTEADMGTGFGYKTAVEALPEPGVLADIQAAIDWVAQAGKVGILGFCWGGLLTWRSACQLRGVSAAVPYYGGGMTVGADGAAQATVPTLAHFASDDHWIPLDTVRAFAATHPGVQVQLYEGHHGFNWDQRASWNAAAATLARGRTLEFLAQHLV